jgi:positive regulator of sigma E activity
MIEEEGIVVEVIGDIAKVAVLSKSACEKCAASGVCHPGGDDSLMDASNPLNAKKGQKVKVVLAPQVFLKASIILYGIPMAVFVAAAILAKNAAVRSGAEASSDLWAFLAGALSLVVSFFFIRRYNKKVERTREYQPVIVEIIG